LDTSNFSSRSPTSPHTMRFAFYVEEGERLNPDDEWLPTSA
jgi:hypothetical protein